MNGKDAIIEKILLDAQIAAKGTKSEAEERADDMFASTVDSCKSYVYAEEAAREAQVADIKKRRQTVAELDVKKLHLAKKKEIIDSAFALAEQELLALDKKTYLAVITGMLKYAEDGDVVTVSARDKDVVTQAFLAAYCKKSGKKLTLSSEYGDFNGGIVLTGSGVDKNLSLAVELKLLKDELETEVAARIFKAK